MKTYFNEEIIGLAGLLHEAIEDAGRFDNGNEAAGVRVRKVLWEVSKRCKHQRLSMLAVSAERRESKCS